MILELKPKILIFSIIFLIISITPVSAGLIHESYATINDKSPKNVNVNESKLTSTLSSVNDLDQDLNELDTVLLSLNQSVTYIMKRKDDFGWKFWKWPGITDDIGKTLSKIHIDANNCEKIISRLKKHISNLKLGKKHSKLVTTDNSPYINNVDNPFCQDDAQYMATRLSETLNATFSVRNVSASELQEGDIIQYLSEGKYPRYLKVQKIASSHTTTKKLLDTTPINVPTGYLEMYR